MSLPRDRRSKLFYGWFIAISAFFVLLIIGGTTYSFGVFFQPLLDEFGWTRAMPSGTFALYMIVHGSFYMVTGRLTDKYGPRIVPCYPKGQGYCRAY